MALTVPNKAVQHDYMINSRRSFIRECGRTNGIIQCDNEPTLKTVATRATAKIGNMTVRQTPAYSSNSRGSVERFHRTLFGQVLRCSFFVGVFSFFRRASMTPDRPPMRFTSPLHEMDENEKTAKATPVQSEATTQELTRDVERLSVDAIARIARPETQEGLQPLQARVSTLNSRMSVCMEEVEGEMKSVKGKMSEKDGQIAKLETATPRSMDSAQTLMPDFLT